MSKKLINRFVEKLAMQEVYNNCNNQYSYSSSTNELRRNNLKLYLLQMLEKEPEVLLVSEAPGYLGMKLTGVPFSSERILNNHPFFSKTYKFKTEKESNISEPSATTVWKTLDDIGVTPLMFPAFPFHPHKQGEYKSNRPPTKNELKIGQEYLKKLISIFKINNFIAVGRKAQETLIDMNIIAPYVRHPSNGGTQKFKEGLNKYLKNI